MRQDFWLFLGYLLGMGTISESEACSHGSVELAVSFNGPMKVVVQGKACECSLLAIGPGTEHTIDGSRGWQFFGYLHPSSRLARLIQEKIDASGKSWICGAADFDRMESILPSLDMEPSPYRVRELWEFLLSHLLGIQSYSLGWSGELKKILEIIEDLPYGELGVTSLAAELGKPVPQVEDLFFKLAGIPLVHFIFNLKLVHASEKIKRGVSLDEAIRLSGLSGVTSVKNYIGEMYGLDMENLLTEKPYIRFFSAADYEQLSGHVL